ncbi:MAG: hypothetical protein J3Q66DRAFT_330754 [Benniella sp.]|nr:MAG: hypothetical protein J3Q66DRAFT_330754 [Benniella sp.]
MDTSPHRLLSVPELVVLIASFLSPCYVSQWMQTCRTVYRQLEPTFWSHLNLTASYTDPSALPRYRHHFRTLQLDWWHREDHLAALIEELPPTTSRQTNVIELFNLKKLVLRCSNVYRIEEDEMDAFVKVLSYSHNLTELDITANVLHHRPDLVDRFLEKIEQLPNLQRLALHGSEVEAEVAHRFLQVCFRLPQLIDLQCHFIISGSHYPSMPDNGLCDPRFAILLKSLQDADKKKSDAGEPRGLRLKSLKLPHICGGYPQDFLFPFLRSHVPHLERLRLPFIHQEYDSQNFEDSILEGCLRLQHIRSDYFPGYGITKCGLSDVIRHCVPLGLKTFRAECPFGFYQRECQSVMQYILDHHAATLEDFEFWGCFYNSSTDLHSVLARCRNLKRFCVCRTGENGIEFKDALSSAWICHDLEQLNLLLGRDNNVPMRKTVNQQGKTVDAQIGGLVKLEELSLGCVRIGPIMKDSPVMKDLTLEDGWLAELAGLKKLRHFCMLTNLWVWMGQAEVEFMVSNWPNLDKISLHMNEEMDGFDLDVFSKPHWRWLKEKRPHIALIIKEW